MSTIQVRFGHGEVELDDRRVVERRHDRAGAHQAADADAAKTGPPVEARADDRVVEPRFRDVDSGAIALEHGLDLVELRYRKRLLRVQVAAALELILALRERGFRLGQRRPRLGGIQLDQHRAPAHEIALLEADRGDDIRGLRGHVHGLVGARRADGLDVHAERLLEDRGRGHHFDVRLRRRRGLPLCASGLEQPAATAKSSARGSRRGAGLSRIVVFVMSFCGQQVRPCGHGSAWPCRNLQGKREP